MRSTTLAVTLLFLHITNCFAQDRETVTQPIEWMALTTNLEIQKHWSLILEGQFRYTGSFDPMQFQFRTAVERQMPKGFSIVPLGYVYTWNPLYGKQPNTYVNNEHRLWQQVGFKHHTGRVRFNHRLRVEQRYLQVHVNQNGEVINKGYDLFLNRIRYRFQVQVPINNNEMTAKTFFAAVANEGFLSWGKNVTYHRPDQNRIYAGIGYQFTKRTTLQGGFNYQLLIKAGGAKQENNIGFLTQLNYNLSLLKED